MNVNKIVTIFTIALAIALLSAIIYHKYNLESVKTGDENYVSLAEDSYNNDVIDKDVDFPNTIYVDGPSDVVNYNDVTFTWAGIDDITSTEDLLYSYILKGKTTVWSPWAKTTSITYTDLPNGSYTFFVKAKDQAGNIDYFPVEELFKVNVVEQPELNTYYIYWPVNKKEFAIEETLFADKNKPFIKTITIPEDNLETITFKLTWKDDIISPILHFGKDILTFTVKSPNSVELYKEKNTGEGSLSFTISDINPRPKISSLEAESLSSAQVILKEHYNTKWKNDPIQIEVHVKIGELRILKRLRDKGNTFELKISYEYYNSQISEIEDNAPDTNIISGPKGTINYDTVTFSWIGLDDITPTDKIEYSYRLEPYDIDWSAWTTKTSKTYYNLAIGEYTFYVKAKDHRGNIDKTPSQQSFILVKDNVNPPDNNPDIPDQESDDEKINRYAIHVVEFNPGVGASSNIDRILGGPNGKGAFEGSLDVLSLGKNGSVILGFDVTIINGPGKDFIVFENPFYVYDTGNMVFGELAYIEVSTDGKHFARFPSISTTSEYITKNSVGFYPTNITNLAGAWPIYTNIDENDINPFDPEEAGGDAFDLEELLNNPLVVSGLVDLQNINYIKILDIVGDGSCLDSQGNPIYDPTYGTNGADIDSVAIINHADT